VVIVGATATGKTTLAIELGKRLNGEIVSADSVQIYQHFDIGSGKPTPEERAACPHHLIDVAAPLEPMEANVWAELARREIEAIFARGRVPIVCGGTFLWVRALLFGLADAPPGDPEVRARHQDIVAQKGRPALHEQLAQVDKESAARLHPNDFVRVSRALEVFELSKRPLSALQEEHGFRKARYRARLVGVRWDKDEYESRLASRVRSMLEQGWKDEVKGLIERGFGAARAMDAVGYRQVREAVLGETATSIADAELEASIVRVTRVFARRQRTWLREEPVEYVESQLLETPTGLDELSRTLDDFVRG
jgi:tRNA dimethylallyltransferase